LEVKEAQVYNHQLGLNFIHRFSWIDPDSMIKDKSGINKYTLLAAGAFC
jgi:hypothetical protein